MELHAVLPLGLDTHIKPKLRLIGPSRFPTSKRRRTCSCFDDRHNVRNVQAAAYQGLWVIYDRCHTWIRTVCAARSSAMTEKARHPRRQRCMAYRLMSAKPTLHSANQETAARRRFIHASRVCQKEYRKLAATRLQNRGRQAAPKTRPPKNTILGKERLPKRTRGGPIFVTVQSKTQPDKSSPRFLLHILERECILRL